MSRMREARRAQEASQFYEALGEGEKSKAFQALPEKAQEAIEAIMENTPFETAYVDPEAWNTYWQDKADPREVAIEVIGDDGTAFDEAVATGAPIPIPMGRYARKLAPTEHRAFFAQEIRQSPEAMNAREAQEFFQAIEGDEEQQAEAAREAPAQESADQVEEALLGQLTEAGFDEATAGKYARGARAVFRTLGERFGLDPLELFERYGITTSRSLEETPAEGRAFGQQDQSFAKGGERDQTQFPLPQRVQIPSSRKAHQKITARTATEGKAQVDAITPRGEFTNRHTQLQLSVSGRTTKKAVDHVRKILKFKKQRGKTHLEVLQYMPQIIENAVLLTEKEDHKDRQKNEKWLYFFSPLRMEGKDYFVKLEVLQERQGLIVHHYAVVPAEGGGHLQPATTGAPATGRGSIPSGSLAIEDFGAQIKALRNKYDFFQGDTEGKRGRIQFGPRGVNIDLFEGANLSTFLHESGHLYLEVLGDLVEEQPDNPMTQDYQRLLKWLGVESRDQIQTEHHEKFARAHEAYLMFQSTPHREVGRESV